MVMPTAATRWSFTIGSPGVAAFFGETGLARDHRRGQRRVAGVLPRPGLRFEKAVRSPIKPRIASTRPVPNVDAVADGARGLAWPWFSATLRRL